MGWGFRPPYLYNVSNRVSVPIIITGFPAGRNPERLKKRYTLQ